MSLEGQFAALKTLSDAKPRNPGEVAVENPNFSQTTIYVGLRELEEGSFISSIRVPNIANRGMPRRIFTILPKGRKYLELMEKFFRDVDELG